MAAISTTHPVLKSAQDLAEKIQQLEEVQRFREAEKQVEQSETVKMYVEQIKRKQKELVHAKHYQKAKYRKQLEKELEILNNEFEQLPIVREYQQIQVSVNDLLQLIQSIIADTIRKKIKVETGGVVSGGCGNGGPCGCRNKI